MLNLSNKRFPSTYTAYVHQVYDQEAMFLIDTGKTSSLITLAQSRVDKSERLAELQSMVLSLEFN
jgi:hypothetical protein